MVSTTQLKNGIWVVQWATFSAISSENVEWDQTSLQIIIVYQGQVTLNLKESLRHVLFAVDRNHIFEALTLNKKW